MVITDDDNRLLKAVESICPSTMLRRPVERYRSAGLKRSTFHTPSRRSHDWCRAGRCHGRFHRGRSSVDEQRRQPDPLAAPAPRHRREALKYMQRLVDRLAAGQAPPGQAGRWRHQRGWRRPAAASRNTNQQRTSDCLRQVRIDPTPDCWKNSKGTRSYPWTFKSNEIRVPLPIDSSRKGTPSLSTR